MEGTRRAMRNAYDKIQLEVCARVLRGDRREQDMIGSNNTTDRTDRMNDGAGGMGSSGIGEEGRGGNGCAMGIQCEVRAR